MERPAARRSLELPNYASRFIGRESQVRQLALALERNRLVTLTGPAGSGKTRLALEAGKRFSRDRIGSAFFVDLAALGEAELLPEAFAAALGITQAQTRTVLERLIDRLDELDCLLIVDNCEHIVEACAALVDRLLRRCQGVRVLATSRESLHVDGELVWQVLPLPLPRSADSVGEVARSEAVRFFVEKSQQSSPGFQLSASNAAGVASICRRLDGLPLALELAAARTRVLDVESIDDQLDDRFRFLTSGFRGAPARQRTLRGAIDWSFDLLSRAERELFVRLSVFAGSFDLTAAKGVCADGAVVPDQVLDLLDRLIAKSLVVYLDLPLGPRYRLLDSLRAYGLDRLRDDGELQAWRKRHCEYFASLAGDLDEEGGPVDWVPRMATEVDNLREALAWSRTGDSEMHLRVANGFGWYSWRAGFIDEGISWLQNALRPEGDDSAVRGDAFSTLAMLAWRKGDDRLAVESIDESVRIFRAMCDDYMLSQSLGDKAFVLVGTDRLDEVESIVNEQLSVADRSGHWCRVAYGLYCRGLLESHRGELVAALRDYTESLELYETEMGEAPALVYNAVAWIQLMSGDAENARPVMAKGLRQRMRMGDLGDIAASLDAFAEAAYLDRDVARAMRLKGAADSIRERAGAVPASMSAMSRERWVARAERSHPQLATSAWREGAQLSAEEAGAYALTPATEIPARSNSKGGPALSEREVQVADLVAGGLSNDEIAARLKLSRRTVEAHLDHIRTKLGARSRVDVATWMAARSTPPLASRS